MMETKKRIRRIKKNCCSCKRKIEHDEYVKCKKCLFDLHHSCYDSHDHHCRHQEIEICLEILNENDEFKKTGNVSDEIKNKIIMLTKEFGYTYNH